VFAAYELRTTDVNSSLLAGALSQSTTMARLSKAFACNLWESMFCCGKTGIARLRYRRSKLKLNCEDAALQVLDRPVVPRVFCTASAEPCPNDNRFKLTWIDLIARNARST